jgi:hypothetical protein
MKNKLEDLNNHLFETLEFLTDQDITGAKLNEQINRAELVCKVAGRIIEEGRLMVDAARVIKTLPRSSRRHLMLEE